MPTKKATKAPPKKAVKGNAVKKASGKAPRKTPARKKALKATIKAAAKKIDEGKKAGRPTDYDPSLDEMARKLCLLGLTDIELAEHFGICEKTLYTWKAKHPTFLQAIHAGGVVADAEIADSLHDLAKGHEKTLKTQKMDKDGCVHELEETIYIPPNYQAGSLWLRNRRSGKWRDKQEVEHTGSVQVKEATAALDAVFNSDGTNVPENL